MEAVFEELILNHMTTGAGNDIERATELARKMVCEWGMSEKLGTLSFGKKGGDIPWPEITQHRDYSEQTAIMIDEEVKRLVLENYDRAKNYIKRQYKLLKALAEALLEKEVLTARKLMRF